jgi:CHAT domain-containing protein
LPGTATETKGVAKLILQSGKEAEVRLGAEASKDGLLHTDLTQYRYIHFATHGIIPTSDRIKEPALILSYDAHTKNTEDLLLSVSNVLQTSLHADMVVLSACNTGSGRITRAEGVLNLGRGFMLAGASSVTVSLWQVADDSTAILMQGYYHNLLAGKSKDEALAAARTELISKGYDNPFFWAPFILEGE